MMKNSLTLDEIFHNITSDKALFIDVREHDEFNEGHIEGALHIPVSAIQKNIDCSFLLDFPHSLFYVYCARTRRAEYIIGELQWGQSLISKTVLAIPYGFSELIDFGFICKKLDRKLF